MINMVTTIEGNLTERRQHIEQEKGNGYAYSDSEVSSKLSDYQISEKVGVEPYMIGTLFGLKEDTWSDALIGDNGVYLIQLKKVNYAEAIEDNKYSENQEKLLERQSNLMSYQIDDAIKELVKIVDCRYKI